MKIGEDSRLTDYRVKEWFMLEQGRKEREKRSTATSTKPVITISRQYGAGGTQIAAKVAEKLGVDWQVWDREIIEDMARSAQVRGQMIEAMDEKTRSWMNEMISSLLGVRFVETQAYHKHLAQVLLALAQQGKKIIMGRGANYVLPEALNVRLIGEEKFRIQCVARDEEIPYEDALKKVKRIDHDRADFTHNVFNRNIDDLSAYDIVLNTGNHGHEPVISAIVAATKEMFKL